MAAESESALNELTAMHNRLPRLEELKIGGRSLADAAEGALPEEAFLETCVEVARQHREILKDGHGAADDRSALELRIRGMVQSLILIYKNYEIAQAAGAFGAREADQWLEQLIAPPIGSNAQLARSMNVGLQIPRVLKAQSRLYQGRSEFVSQWLEFKERSLASTVSWESCRTITGKPFIGRFYRKPDPARRRVPDQICVGRRFGCDHSSSWWPRQPSPPGGSRFSRNGGPGALRPPSGPAAFFSLMKNTALTGQPKPSPLAELTRTSDRWLGPALHTISPS